MSKIRPCGECNTCRRCRDRNRKRAIKAGTHVPYKAKGRKAERLAAEKRRKKLLSKCFQAWQRQRTVIKAAHTAAKRRRHDYLFKTNVEKFGVAKTKMICVCVRKKKLGTWRHTNKSILRWQEYKMDRMNIHRQETTAE